MATQQRSSEETEARGQEIRTLAIAAVASGLAAVIVSQFWFAGTWIAAALTPIVVTIVRELLERPTSKIAERVTADRTAVQPRVVMPPDEEPRVEPGAGDRRVDEPAPIRVYGKKQPSRKRKLALRAAVVTGLLGFVIAFSAITITDLVAGKSVTGSGKRLTFGGGKSDKKDSDNATDTTEQDQGQDSDQQQTQPQDSEQQQTQPQEQQQTAPQQTTPQTTPTTPTTTTPSG